QQVSFGQYPNYDQSNSSKYSLQSLCTQSHQESTAQSIFPKPIYSYSILIFLALKNSKTGRLPVSEIYSFMTEHFPYFKSAPDGWKNSVRHNLSLNKCFQKVENKSENLSRKGCLWALNPAKVEKMQEELHKWRRKDPISVRRSMASPEDLDRLLGEKPTKLRSLPPFTNPYAHVQPPQPCYLPPATAQPSHSFALYSPCGQQPAAGVPSATGGLPMAGKMPPSYNGALQAEYCSRSMQDLLLEGGASYDIDTLNPSLTDLQLQGNLWDSLVFDPRVTTTSALQDHRVQTGCPRVTSPGGQTSDVGRQKAGDEDENTDRSFDQHDYSNGLHPAVYSGVESLAGYLTSCSTSISLI
uniref:Forkhead box N1 n=1 Tax=Cyclopterus lumpus TaxID=8103 RepID=A0A8C2X8Z9_CYCLU